MNTAPETQRETSAPELDDRQLQEAVGGFTPDGRQLVVTIKDGPTASGVNTVLADGSVRFVSDSII
jgi:hypothetical protein